MSSQALRYHEASMGSSGWLTTKRLRGQAFLLALVLWSIYTWTIATPGLRDRNANLKGTDFLHFYTLGLLALEHRGADLYNTRAQTALAAQRGRDAAGIQYLPLYPPQVSLLFAPLAALSYAKALAVWWAFGAVTYAACCFSIWRVCPRLKSFGWTVALTAAAFPPFFHLIAWGQTSALALACFTGFFFLMRQRRDFLAGIVLGLLIFKPQLGLASALLFACMGAWKIIAGALLSAGGELFAGLLYYGFEPLHRWLQTLWNARNFPMLLEPRPYQTHCLRTFWSMLIPSHSVSFALYVTSAAIAIGWTAFIWKRTESWEPRFSLLLLTSVLISPHLTVYDLVILAPAFLLLADWLIANRNAGGGRQIGMLLYLVYALPLLGPLTSWSHVQLSVVAMIFLAYLTGNRALMKDCRQDTTPCAKAAET